MSNMSNMSGVSNRITLAQADEIADQLVTLAELLSDLRFQQFANLSVEDRNELRRQVSTIRRQASDLTALIVGQKLDDLPDHLKAIAQATNVAEKALGQIQQVRKAINLGTAIIRLAAAVMTLNPTAILAAASSLIAVSQAG